MAANSTGFLANTIARIRMFTDEPDINKKYSDSTLIDLIEAKWTTILAEINRNKQAPIVVRHNITFASGSTQFILPPTVGTVLRLAKLNSQTGSVEWEVTPRSRYNPCGPGVIFEGNVIRVEPNWGGASETLSLDYIPTGDVRLHDGTAGTITNDTTADECTIVLAASPTTGNLDNRPNAYAGSVLRILSATSNDFVQERVVHSYDVTTRTATLKPSFTAALLPGGTVTYEIAPLMHHSRNLVVALAVVRAILGIEGAKDRVGGLSLEYADEIRNLRLASANLEVITGTRYQSDTTRNRRHLSW